MCRATPQWFCDLAPIKERALAALDNVTFHPPSGRTRLDAFVRGRSEWCISRQRAWGVPLPVIYNLETDEPVLSPEALEHIIGVLDAEGVDSWWTSDVDKFVPVGLKAGGRRYRKGQDTMDVWFDSGCSWTVVEAAHVTGRPTDAPLADLVLEGSDQHRGWFQSLLLTAIGSQLGRAPYANVITHGFSLDTEGRKMSKSLGNVISPIELIEGNKVGPRPRVATVWAADATIGEQKAGHPAYGVDVVRLWAGSVDYTRDHPVGHTVLQQAADTLRKIRITARFILGSVCNTAMPLPPIESLDIVRSRFKQLPAQIADGERSWTATCCTRYTSSMPTS